MNGYEYSRKWFDFAFENPEHISPNHAAIYFFAIEHCNRLGWKEKFGFPTQMAMEAIGIKKHSTYIRYFNDLVDWGFFKLIQKSQNQYSSNIICLSNALPKTGGALGKANGKHTAKQKEINGQSTGQTKRSINKPLTLEPLTLEPINWENENVGADAPHLENGVRLQSGPDRAAAFFSEGEEKKNPQLEILEECVIPFDSENFMDTWLLFLEYKRKRKNGYTSKIGMQAALKKCSNFPEDVVIKSLMESMANNHQGFFPEKFMKNGKQAGNNSSRQAFTPQSDFRDVRSKIT